MIDLTGHWTGSYAYPGSLSPVPFEVELRDTGGRLSGVCSEQCEAWSRLPPQSTFHGRRRGSDVTMTKIYDAHDEHIEPVEYRGTVDEDACEISGNWTIAGTWSGPFVMTRPKTAAVEEALEVGVTV